MKAIEANLKASKCFTMTLTGIILSSLWLKPRRQGASHLALTDCPSGTTSVTAVYRLSSVFNAYRMGFTLPIPKGTPGLLGSGPQWTRLTRTDPKDVAFADSLATT
ncbi:uncharacterized protein DS421_15g500560 [Arachis hypogaea]|nr:uncharacterized protein DS421_15g500560 [Arachis hypogaea]